MSVHRLHALYPWQPEEGVKSPETEMQMVVNQHVSAGKRLPIVWKTVSALSHQQFISLVQEDAYFDAKIYTCFQGTLLFLICVVYYL